MSKSDNADRFADLGLLASQLKTLEEQLGNGDIPVEELSRFEKTATVIQVALQAEKLNVEIRKIEMEAANLRRVSRSETLRFWIPVLAPLAGAAALVVTLFVQMLQFNENVGATRRANEGAQFREVVQALHLQDSAMAYANQATLATFLDSKEFGPQARQVAIVSLATIASYEGFKNLFSRIFTSVKYSDLTDLVRVTRIQLEQLRPMMEARDRANQDVEKAKKAEEEKRATVGTQVAVAQNKFDRLNQEIDRLDDDNGLVSSAIAGALRNRPPAERPDLSRAQLWQANFTGLDFGRADLTGTWFHRCDLTDSDLGQITDFEDIDLYKTQWWRAKKIHPALLRALKDRHPYDSSVTDYVGPAPSQADYEKNLARLTNGG